MSLGKNKVQRDIYVNQNRFEKAYGRLRWSNIRDNFLRVNLFCLLIIVIMDCVNSTLMKVLLNGGPPEF